MVVVVAASACSLDFHVIRVQFGVCVLLWRVGRSVVQRGMQDEFCVMAMALSLSFMLAVQVSAIVVMMFMFVLLSFSVQSSSDHRFILR